MIDLNTIFHVKSENIHRKKYREVFEKIKPYVKERIVQFLDGRRKSTRGRKREVDLDHLLDCLFYITDNGIKLSYTKELFNIPRSTYYFYFKLISDSNILEQIHNEIVKEYHTDVFDEDHSYMITDTFTVKSMDGSDGVGRNPTDRGRNGIKVSLICDHMQVTHAVYIVPANVHDAKTLLPTINSSITDLHDKKCLDMQEENIFQRSKKLQGYH